MSNRQIRLSDRTEIRNKIASYLGQKINIVMDDSRVLFGVLKTVSGDDVTIVNMRLKKTTFHLNTISELYIDLKS